MTLGKDHLHGQDQSGLKFSDPLGDEPFGGNPDLALVSFCTTVGFL